VVEVRLQTRHLGWQTDDLLVVGETSPGVTRQLAIQAKRTFTISAADEECVKTICGMWDDFSATDRFDKGRDRLAVATLHGTRSLLGSFGSLLDCARSAIDQADFERRVGLSSYLSQKARDQNETLKAILDKHVEGELDAQLYWEFLRVFNVLSLDLGTSTSSTEALVLSLLAHVARGPGDPKAIAQATWVRLLEVASEGRQSAKTYRRESLPTELVEQHEVVPRREERARLELVAHGRTVRDSIRSTIGGAYLLDRSPQVATLLDQLDEHRVVVVFGTAGSGKSALVKVLLEHIDTERPVLAFQAVEFATAHINETLARTQTALNAEALLALLAAHDRTVVFVDGVERLLEHSVRDAFTHLMQIAARTPTLRLLLTCREYSLETVRSALLTLPGLAHTVLEVPPVSDDELDTLAEQVQSLAPPLSDPHMRSFLRTLYLLDMASRLQWSNETLPQDVRAFREVCWRQLVRDDDHPAVAMPRRREIAFMEVARLRATELRPFVRPQTDDHEALRALEEEALLERSPESSSLFAPAHDVLEDWAILHWLDEVQSAVDDRAGALSEAVGGLPAVRRGLRRWLTERLDMDASATTDFILGVSARADLSQHFRDDCIVAALLSNAASDFVAGCRDRIAAGDTSLLKQVVHLLRVACKATPQWLPASGAPSMFLVPTGPAWAPMLELLAESMPSAAGEEALLALGMVDDWSKQISITMPSPPGADSAGHIVSHLLRLFEGYGYDDPRKRALEVLLKIPRHAAAFGDLAARALADDWQDRGAREFSNLVLSTFSSASASRDFPDTVIGILRARLIIHDATLRRYTPSTLDVAECFGIRKGGISDYFPASALQGPFLALLRHHPQKAVAFIIELLNHAGDWYGNQRGRGHDLEPAVRVTLEVPWEGPSEQWLNGRLFALYRAMTVGPHSLQSAAMALESWLLDMAKREGFDLESWLLHILRQSNNVMATGVVVSLCIAYPDRAGRAAIAVLSCREVIALDRQRVANEQMHSVEFMAGLNPSHRVYEEERRSANALPHRRQDLEHLAVKLQLTDMRGDVWALLDRYRAALTDAPDQDDLVWRLALHRMDIRGYGPVVPPAAADETSGEGVGRAYLGPRGLEPEVQELVDSSSERWSEFNRHLRLTNAANAAWERMGGNEALEWRTLLSDARACAAEGGPLEPYLGGGPGIVAAVSIRDHLPDLSPAELEWCAGVVVNALAEADEADDLSKYSHMFGPDRAAAAVAAILVAKAPQALKSDPTDLLLRALTHPVEEVADYAFAGAGAFLGAEQRDLILRCAAAAVVETSRREAQRSAEYERSRGESPPKHSATDPIRQAVRAVLIGSIEAARAVIGTVAFDSWEGRRAARHVCKLLGRRKEWSESRAFFKAAAGWLAKTWKAGRSSRSHGQRDFHAEADLSREIARFALNLPEVEALSLVAPLIDLVLDEPREVADFVHELILGADGGGGDSFWPLWQGFAESTVSAPWIARLDREQPYEAPLISRLFLITYWKEGVKHWERLDGEAHRVHSLAQRLPPSAVCVEVYARFLYTIGQQSLPEAFEVIDSVLRRGDAVRVVSESEASFYVESLLGRFVYGQPQRLKTDPGLRAAVLRVLDVLVSAGSSAAYRMRDDFVTPMRLGNS
jgi:hypothetical protein